jgi:hypothetical protein
MNYCGETDLNNEPRGIFVLQGSHQASSLWQDEGAAEHQSLDLAPSFLPIPTFELFHVFAQGFGAWHTTVGMVDYDSVFTRRKDFVDRLPNDLHIWIEVSKWW